jgi:hypothetical protein
MNDNDRRGHAKRTGGRRIGDGGWDKRNTLMGNIQGQGVKSTSREENRAASGTQEFMRTIGDPTVELAMPLDPRHDSTAAAPSIPVNGDGIGAMRPP